MTQPTNLLWRVAIVLSVALPLMPGWVLAQESRPALVTGAGTAVFAKPATLGAVALTSVEFGLGTDVRGGGCVEATLRGTTLAGAVREIALVGDVSGGSLDAVGVATLSGLATLDLRDGTPPLKQVPVTAVVVPGAKGLGTLTLTVGSTNLPLATVSHGRLTVVP